MFAYVIPIALDFNSTHPCVFMTLTCLSIRNSFHAIFVSSRVCYVFPLVLLGINSPSMAIMVSALSISRHHLMM